MRIAALAVIVILTICPVHAQHVGVTGEDNRRVAVEPIEKLNAIGRVNIAGFNRRNLCTGTLVQQDKVVTAAHCLYNKRTKRPFPVHTIHFVAGKRLDDFAAHSKVKAVSFLNEYDKKPTLENDVAVLTLSTPLTLNPLPLAAKQSSHLSHVLYGKDRPHLPAIDETCELKGIFPKGIWLTSCDTTQGGSGGPVFFRDKAGETAWAVAAVMVAGIQGRGSVAIPLKAWRHLLTR